MISHRLQRSLVDYDMAMLRALAQNRGAALATNRQQAAADELATALLDPLSVRAALTRLSPQGRMALDTLLASGGSMRAPQFTRRFGPVRPIGPGRLERETPWLEPASATEELLYAGLLFRGFFEDAGGPGEFVFVPEDLRPLLPQPQAEPSVFAVAEVDSPIVAKDGGSDFVHDLFVYLAHLHNHDVQPYADGRLGRRTLAALHARLADADERRLALLRHLAGRLGFVDRQGDYLRLDPAPVKRWLTDTPAQQLAALHEAWREDPTWNDLCQVPGLTCDREPTWRNDPVATRRALLDLLARCPADAWWSLASFVAAVKEIHPDFQRPDGDYSSWYIRDAATGEYLSGFQSWDRVDGVLLTDLIQGPLCWLGVIAAYRDQEDTACRLTTAGAQLLGLPVAEPEAPPSPPLVVRSDFRVEVPPPASLYTQFQLERFADLESQAPCRYHITVGGLGRALGRGIQVEQVLAFLQQASGRPVPPNVAAQLRLWAGRYGQVELQEVALLQTASERVLKELSVLPETRELIARVLSPTTALVRKRDLPRLQKALRDLGFLPSDAGPSGEPPERG